MLYIFQKKKNRVCRTNNDSSYNNDDNDNDNDSDSVDNNTMTTGTSEFMPYSTIDYSRATIHDDINHVRIFKI